MSGYISNGVIIFPHWQCFVMTELYCHLLPHDFFPGTCYTLIPRFTEISFIAVLQNPAYFREKSTPNTSTKPSNQSFKIACKLFSQTFISEFHAPAHHFLQVTKKSKFSQYTGWWLATCEHQSELDQQVSALTVREIVIQRLLSHCYVIRDGLGQYSRPLPGSSMKPV